MAFYANVIKVVQYVSIAFCTDFSVIFANLQQPTTLLAFLVLCGFGQHLNYMVYERLGINGVYYGFRFGKTVPWVDAYPYSVMRDPQYIGCILSLGGVALAGVPMEICLWWFANYLYLMWVESKVPDTAVY
jgi:methylene-fatty-acyl-phospholipid synthase